MPLRLDMRNPDFEAQFVHLLAMKREVSDDVDQAVRSILADVQKRGDEALIDLSSRFERVDLRQFGLRVSAAVFR